MAVCPSCGASLVPPYRFCPSCGRPVPERLPYPPPASYPPPAGYIPARKDNAVPIVVVIVVVVIVLSIALPAILYAMVSGLISVPNTPAKPTITLVATSVAGGARIMVAGIVPAAPPSSFKLNIQNATSFATGTATGMAMSAGASVQVRVSSVTFSIVWGNPGGSGQVSQGDTFGVTYAAALGTRWTFLIIWAVDGSVLSTATWQT